MVDSLLVVGSLSKDLSVAHIRFNRIHGLRSLELLVLLDVLRSPNQREARMTAISTRWKPLPKDTRHLMLLSMDGIMGDLVDAGHRNLLTGLKYLADTRHDSSSPVPGSR
jgi:hypothetical protein